MIAALFFAAVSVPNLAGHPVQVFPSSSKKGVVAFFVMTGCPIANSYVPEMNRIAKKYGPKGWQFDLAYVDSLFSPEGTKKHYKEFGYAFPALNDSGHVLANLAGATRTPEVAVFSPSGKVLYDGRIDDLFYALGKRRYEATTHDLRDALDALTAGKAPKKAKTEVIGCVIPMD